VQVLVADLLTKRNKVVWCFKFANTKATSFVYQETKVRLVQLLLHCSRLVSRLEKFNELENKLKIFPQL